MGAERPQLCAHQWEQSCKWVHARGTAAEHPQLSACTARARASVSPAAALPTQQQCLPPPTTAGLFWSAAVCAMQGGGGGPFVPIVWVNLPPTPPRAPCSRAECPLNPPAVVCTAKCCPDGFLPADPRGGPAQTAPRRRAGCRHSCNVMARCCAHTHTHTHTRGAVHRCAVCSPAWRCRAQECGGGRRAEPGGR